MNPNKWKEFFLKSLHLVEFTPEGAGERLMLPEGLEGYQERRADPVLRAAIKEAYETTQSAFESTGAPIPKEVEAPAEWTPVVIELYLSYLNKVATAYLAFAVIEDDRTAVKTILDAYPDLLLFKDYPLVITSELTGQKFSVDTILGIACRRKQIEMVKILLPYFDKLQKNKDEQQAQEIEAIKNVGLAEWQKYQFDAGKNIQVPAEYQTLINGLIDAFKAEPIAPNTPVKTLSDTVETAMNVLYERLLPGVTNEEMTEANRPVFTKENHLDVELLLYAAYNAYNARYGEFQTDAQRDAYCIRVIGIVQNFLPPETGKIFCEGLYYVVEDNQKMSARAEGLKLADGKTDLYHRLNLALRVGGGFDYLVGGGGGDMGGASWGAGRARLARDGWRWGNSVKQKQQFFETYPATPAAPNTSPGLRA